MFSFFLPKPAIRGKWTLFVPPWLFCLFAAMSIAQVVSAQSMVKGSPAIRNYTPEEFNAHNQNWTILQDQRGVMYFGNAHGILEYDGVTWRTIQTQNKTIVRSLAMGYDDRIYAGGFAEIGYLAPDSNQQLQFVSLMDQVEESKRNFSDVWQTISTADAIFFVTQKYIFRWDGETMYTWTANHSFHVGFEIYGKFYVRHHRVGMMQAVGDSLELIPLGEQFASERIMTMLPYGPPEKKQILMATKDDGLFLYDGQSLRPFSTDADRILKESQVYCGVRLTDKQFALGTLQNGVVVLDENGRIHHRLNKATGLQDETIWYLYADRQSGLWIGMHNGISRAEVNSPFTHFGEREGIEGSVLEVVRHQGFIYGVSSMGVYYLDDLSNIAEVPGKFNRVADVSPQGWALLPFGNKLIAATFDGVFEIVGGKGRLINGTYAVSLHRSQRDSNRVFVGLHQGMKSLYYKGGSWIDEGMIKGIDKEIISIYETSEGKLWLTARFNGLGLVDFSEGFNLAPVYTKYDTLHGLPSMVRNVAFTSNAGIRFGTANGFYSFDEEQQRFFPDTSLVKGIAAEDLDLFSINMDRKDNLWIISEDFTGIGLLEQDKTYRWYSDPFLRLGNMDTYFAYPDPLREEMTWLGCIDRMMLYDGSKEGPYDIPFQTLIRQVFVNDDSLLYGGIGTPREDILTLSHGYKSLRIHYAAPYFDDESKTLYQYQLEGYDAAWSNWTTEAYKDYTGLPSGNYRFYVRSKNLYGRTGETAILNFEILPPFYRTWWAYIIYALLFGALMYVLVKIQLAEMHQKHVQKLKQVEFEKLKELDQLKTNFFANISHEFRTPLTLILGPVDKLLVDQPEAGQVNLLSTIKRNAQRLLNLVNQLLDLSKLEAGKMQIELAYDDLVPIVSHIVSSFESLAFQKNMQITLEHREKSIFLQVDRNKIEQVLINLLSNAVKFTPDGGSIKVILMANADEGFAQIVITDNGPGIAADQLPHIFDRFYQGSASAARGEPGSGIGLALVRELVELHKGKIEATSELNAGTTFNIKLPFSGESSFKTTGVREPDVSSAVKVLSLEINKTVPITESIPADKENILLLVEDNPDMRAFIKEAMQGEYNVIEAVDGQDGLEKALDLIPDIIISDVMMPRMDGLELCGKLKQDERTSHIPMVLLTSRADIESRLAGLIRGADDYLAKPFNREELMIRSRNLLELRKRLWKRYAGMEQLPPVEEPDVQVEDSYLLKVRGIVEEHLTDSGFEIESLARLLGVSRSQLFRKIKALTGQSPSLYIRAIRLQRGKELLETTDKNVSEVAYEVGFSTPTYFSDAFMETFGFRPSQLKK